jgi:hypothetical protein
MNLLTQGLPKHITTLTQRAICFLILDWEEYQQANKQSFIQIIHQVFQVQ